MDNYLVIGEIVKPQGVRGEVKLRPITCDVERFNGLAQAYFRRGEDFIPVHIRASRRAQEAVFLTLEGVEDRDAAEKLRGELLYIDRAHAVELDEDTNFLCDLIGLHGVDDEGGDLGTLRDVLQPGGNDVYVFERPARGSAGAGAEERGEKGRPRGGRDGAGGRAAAGSGGVRCGLRY